MEDHTNVNTKEPMLKIEEMQQEDKAYKLKAALFLTGLSSISIFSGFAYAIGTARKSDSQMFDKAMRGTKDLPMPGSTLAIKAFGWGSIYAVSGVTIFCYLVWKLSGAKNMLDFREKVQTLFPQVEKVNSPGERTNFKSLTDLLQYIIDKDRKTTNNEKVENNQLNNESK